MTTPVQKTRGDNTCEIHVQPEVSLADRPLTSLRITNLEPHQQITLRAGTRDEAGVSWMSWGAFQSNQSGTVDLSRQSPLAGTLSKADPSAILWSMRPQGDMTRPVPMFEKNGVMPLSIDVSVEKDGKTLGRRTLKRVFHPEEPRVTREHIDREGITGTLFHPEGRGPHPAVIILSGSGGGISEPRAALMAAHGYAAFALAYFGVGSLPKELHEIPVEFIETGLSWLAEHGFVDGDRIGICGYSKGGELALLLGSLYPQIKAVAAFSGSAFVWQGIRFGRPSSSWTQGGQKLPCLPMKMPLSTLFRLLFGKTVAFRESYERGLKASRNVEPALIPVERIKGPIFLAAGTDDQVWPAANFADTIVDRLKQHRHPYPCQYLKEKGAGHLVCMPYLPGAQFSRNLIFTSSDPGLNALAAIKAWDAMVGFFEEFLK